MDNGKSFAHPTVSPEPLKMMQAKQAEIQAAQRAIGNVFKLGRSDRLVSVLIPIGLVGAALAMLTPGAAKMYTQPGKNA